MTCKTCKHWQIEEGAVGICRRYPPQTHKDDDGDFFTSYVATMAEATCGEWARKEVFHG